MPDNVEGQQNPRYLHNPYNFMNELSLEFGRMDRNGDGVVTADEIQTFLKRPTSDNEQRELAHFMLDHYDDLKTLTSSKSGIAGSGLYHLQDIIAPDTCSVPPSATEIIGKGAAGGAAGGAVTAWALGDSAPRAAGTGALVGAAIGALVAAGQSQDGPTVGEEETVLGWNYFDFVPCTGKQIVPGVNVAPTSPAKTPQVSDRVIHDQLASLPKSSNNEEPTASLTPMLNDFPFNSIDFNRNGWVTKDDLKEAIANNYLSDEQKPVAAILAKHFSEISRGNNGISSDDYDDLVAVTDPHHYDSLLQEERHDAKTGTALSAGIGCAWGVVFGGAMGGPFGAAAGCAIGASALGGPIYLLTDSNERKTRAHQKSLSAQAFSSTLEDLKSYAESRKK